MKYSWSFILLILLLTALIPSVDGGIFGWLSDSCGLNPIATDRVALEKQLGNVHIDSGTCKPVGIVAQPIALSVVSMAIVDHFVDENPKKPLVFNFFGSSGIGKTFMETHLRSQLYSGTDKDGNGEATLTISGVYYRENTADNPEKLKQLQERLRREVIRQVRKCPNSMIVLVEVHFMAPGVLTALVDLLGFRQPISLPGYGEVDFRKTVFVMISNHGYDELQDRVTHLLQTKDRAALTYSDFSPLLKSITSSALDEWLVFKNRVDYYIPFIPMMYNELETYANVLLKAHECARQKENPNMKLFWDESLVKWIASQHIPENTLFAEGGLAPVINTLTVDVYTPLRMYIITNFKSKYDKIAVTLSVSGEGHDRQLLIRHTQGSKSDL
eukprot:m.113224 g.113224  ORF g.113224 m.113224 type:complete len:386 (+) comp14124_c0_seq3:279-1436(+)